MSLFPLFGLQRTDAALFFDRITTERLLVSSSNAALRVAVRDAQDFPEREGEVD
jgi:hypothetical protein